VTSLGGVRARRRAGPLGKRHKVGSIKLVPIGGGGMGVLYQARDTRLSRRQMRMQYGWLMRSACA